MSTLLFEEKKTYTYEDYLKTPDDERYELINGELIMSPSPVTFHQWVLKNIGRELEKFVSKKKLGYVFYAPLDVYFDDKNVFQPDILFIAKDRVDIISKKNIQGAPDIAIEILSESTAYKDLVKKKKIYEKFGVQEYWVADPEEKTIEIHILKNKVFVLNKSYSKNKLLESPLLKDFKMKLDNVFASWK